MKPDWKLEGIKKDKQNITTDWELVNQKLIQGVKIKEVKNIIKDNGALTEIFRRDWLLDNEPVDQIFQVKMNPKAISGWHAHEHTLDRIFVNFGLIKIVLYDARPDSSTYGLINEFRIGEFRPTILTIPPKVFHAVQNIYHEWSALLNIVDRAYQYEDPDHWRVPINDPSIPYSFEL